MLRLINYVHRNVSELWSFLKVSSGLMPPGHPALAFTGTSEFTHRNTKMGESPIDGSNFLRDLLGDGILWAVPKHRRSIEKRLKRKFGVPEYDWKPLRVKEHLRVCMHCGHDYEAGVLCPNCYDRVRKETTEMQEQIQEQLGLDPVDKDVIVLYENERQHIKLEDLEGKRIVEIPKQRPPWFTKNLLQRSTQQPSSSTEIKPDHLA